MTKHTIHVLKPFMLTFPPIEGVRVGKERFFATGDHEVDEDVYAHPYISRDFADGRIERPAQTKARLDALVEASEKAKEQALSATTAANLAFARLKASEPQAKASEEEITRELNTPVSELKKAQGADLSRTVSTLKLKEQKSA